MPESSRLAVLGPVLALLGACRAPEPEPAAAFVEGPRLRVIGTVQDGGLPHPACTCTRCLAARRDPALRRHVASLALVPDDGRVILIDATPDLREQLAMIEDLRDAPADRVDRAPIDGVFVSHAHVGHYIGLSFLGFEAVSAHDVDAFVSPAMREFLQHNAPWDQLVRLGNVTLRPAPPGEPVRLGRLTVTPISVPHRNEYADTVGYRITGPRCTVLYVPDCAPWDRWPTPPLSAFDGVDVAILDGTFYSLDELPGRDPGETGHPLVVDTMDLLQTRVDAGLVVHFTHLNHSNPALQPHSPQRREIERRGFTVLAEGVELAL